LAIKLSEKESLLKSFSVFFVVIETLLLMLFISNYKIQKKQLKDNILLQMKNYSFTFVGKKFDIDLIAKNPAKNYYVMYEEPKDLYMIIPIPNDDNDIKVFYPSTKFKQDLKKIKISLLNKFIVVTAISLIISFVFSLFILKPLRDSSKMLESFIKDIIHDLNTPLTSILLNLKLLDIKNEEIESIECSANTIAMLHKNLDDYLKDIKNDPEEFDVKDIVQKNVDFFKSIYINLNWNVNLNSFNAYTDKSAFFRVVHNLLSNACKYNIVNGNIDVILKDNYLKIINTSYGVKNPDRVFERFYKESERGIGIGLHLVKKILKDLNIDIDFRVDKNIVTVSLNLTAIKN